MNFGAFSPFLVTAGIIDYPSARRFFRISGPYALSLQALPTDSIGNFVLTLTNVVVGSAIQIESQDGSTIFNNQVAASSTVVISLFAYAPGSALNNIRIKVRKGSSSPFYQPFETLAIASVGSQTIFVSQILDE